MQVAVVQDVYEVQKVVSLEAFPGRGFMQRHTTTILIRSTHISLPSARYLCPIKDSPIRSIWPNEGISEDRDVMNLAAGLGVAVREFKMSSGHGFADYMLFVDGKAVGVLEAKPVGYTLSSVELQADKYATGLPAGLNPPVNPLPFLYVSTGVDTRFINGLDPEPSSVPRITPIDSTSYGNLH